MPTYEYACRSCGEHLEVVQSFKDDALTECPSCQGELRKVFSAAGLIFKGSGWHVKDYASSSSKTAPSTTADGGSSSDGATTGSGSSDGGGSSSSSSSSSSSDGGTSTTSTPAKSA